MLPIRGPLYLAAEAITRAIDDLAGLMTGRYALFWARAVSVPGTRE
jgi:hypothetical protein